MQKRALIRRFVVLSVMVVIVCSYSIQGREHEEVEWVKKAEYSPYVTEMLRKIKGGCTFSKREFEYCLSENDPRTVDLCIMALKKKGICSIAAQWLGDSGEKRAIEPLMEAVNDLSLESMDRYRAIEALAKIGGDRVRQFLKQKMKEGLNDIEWVAEGQRINKLEVMTIIALYMLGEEDYEDRVIGFILDRPGPANLKFIRRSAVRALTNKKLGKSSILRLLKHGLISDYDCVKECAIKVMGRYRVEEAIEPLCDIMMDNTNWYHLREASADALSEIGEAAIPVLTEALRNKDRTIRELAAEALIGIDSPRINPILFEMLNDSDHKIWTKAAMRLADLKIGEPLEFLRDKLFSGSETDKIFAARSLGEIGDKRAVQILCDFLKGVIEAGSDIYPEKGYSSVFDAIVALGKLKDRRAVPLLLELLGCERMKNSKPVLLALGQIGTKKCISVLNEIYYKGVRRRKTECKSNTMGVVMKYIDSRSEYWALAVVDKHIPYYLWLVHSKDGKEWGKATFTGLTSYSLDIQGFSVERDMLRIRFENPVNETLSETLGFLLADDLREVAIFLPELRNDSDRDGLSDIEEKRLFTDPFNPDTDGDGLTDYEDVNPLVGSKERVSTRDSIRQAVFSYMFESDKRYDCAAGILPIVVVMFEDAEKQEFLGYKGYVLSLSQDQKESLMGEIGDLLAIFYFEEMRFSKDGSKAEVDAIGYWAPLFVNWYSMILERKHGVWVIVREYITSIS